MNKSLLLLTGAGLLLLSQNCLDAQTAADRVVPVTVTTSANPPAITLSFPATPNTTSLRIGKKSIFQTAWSYKTLPVSTTSWKDTLVSVGTGYEYRVEKQSSTAPTLRYGFVYAGIELPPIEYRGKVILVIDDALAVPLGMELGRFEQDLRGDGWQVIRHDINTGASTVSSVKALLRADYQADSVNTTAAFLIGNIPVPYSGNIAPDGHPEHQGAWPTDYYYSDMTESGWTDFVVDNNQAARAANRNVPGDGKFDQSQTPSPPELVVSRLDFSNLSGWDVSQTELYRRYLNKNHAFRTGEFRPENKTLVDDNFGYFGGEAFAQNAWSNGYALTGPNSVVAADFFNGTESQRYLIGYGCGSGTYTGAGGVGTSANFMTDTVNISFAMLFGSYHGDWDYETNPFMPSALASKGGILTCSWAGRPNWFFHHTGMGLPVWVSTLWTWYNSFIFPQPYPAGSSSDLIHVGLLGDPTLRIHAVKPPDNVSIKPNCKNIRMDWTASADTGVLGYAIYRAPAADSVHHLIAVVTDSLHFIDASPLPGQNFYQVKTFNLQTTPTGSYYNQSTGVPVTADLTAQPFAFNGTVKNVSCNAGADGQVTLAITLGNPQNLTFLWSNADTTQNITGVPAGKYTVTVTNTAGCTMTGSYTVTQPGPINRQVLAQNVTCFGLANGSINLLASGGTPPYKFAWSNGSTGTILTNLPAGTYTVTISDKNGCSVVDSTAVSGPPEISISLSPTPVTCNGGSNGIILSAVSGGVPGYSYKWSNGASTPALANIPAGFYTLTVTDQSGCTKTATDSIQQPSAISVAATVTNALCANDTSGAIMISVSGGKPGYRFAWSNGDTTQQLVHAGSGQYTVTVTDLAGCTRTATATIGATSTLWAISIPTNVSCFGGADGSATVTATGGKPGYTYLWSTGQTTAEITGVPAGTYTATVTDNTGCTRSTTILITQPSMLHTSISWVKANCKDTGNLNLTVIGGTPGYTFLWSNGSTLQNLINVPPATYTVTVTDSKGCTASASITPPVYVPIEVAFDIKPVSCYGGNDGKIGISVTSGQAPYTLLWSGGPGTNLDSLESGIYSFTITDANGCSTVASAVVSEPDQLTLTSTKTDIFCFGGSDGSLTVNTVGGIAPYTYLWSTGSADNPLSGLPSGNYTVTVSDLNGCTAVLPNLVLADPPAVQGIYQPWQEIICPNLTTILYIDTIYGGGGGPYTFSLDNGPALSPDIPLSIAAGIHILTYYDLFGCSINDTFEVMGPASGVLIAGSDTACLNLQELYALQGSFNSAVWSVSNGGAITQGQGTGAVTVLWSELGLNAVTAILNYGAGCTDTIETGVFVDVCSGTQGPGLPGVQVLPNPFNSWINMQSERDFQPGSRWRLTNVQGQLMQEQPFSGNGFRVDTGNWPAGTYFLQIFGKDRSGVWKLIKAE